MIVETGKPLTDIPGQNEEVIVGQGTVLVRVQKGINIKAVLVLVVLFQNFQSLGVVLELGGHGSFQSITVGNRHFARKKIYGLYHNTQM